MVNSSPGTGSWSLAVVLALLAVTAGLVWYFSTSNAAEAGTLDGSPALEARGLERIVEIVAGQMAAVEF